jgi:hypothetical protein
VAPEVASLFTLRQVQCPPETKHTINVVNFLDGVGLCMIECFTSIVEEMLRGRLNVSCEQQHILQMHGVVRAPDRQGERGSSAHSSGAVVWWRNPGLSSGDLSRASWNSREIWFHFSGVMSKPRIWRLVCVLRGYFAIKPSPGETPVSLYSSSRNS